ncbi:MAG: hypothetical protein ACI8WB_003583 [Phenylobacterium sp.]|jgi:uncharacterized protein (DUF885 family)
MKQSVLLPGCLLACSFVLIGCGGSGGSTTTPTPTPPVVVVPPVVEIPTLDDVIDYALTDTSALLATIGAGLDGISASDFYDQAYAILAKRDPQRIITSGQLDTLPLDTIELTNISDDYEIQTSAIRSLILSKLQLLDRSSLSVADQLTWDVVQADLLYKIEASQYLNFNYVATYGMFGWQGSTEQLFTSLLPLTDKNDAEQYLNLLNQVGRRFTQLMQLIDTRTAAGIIEPAVTMGFAQGQVANMAATAVTATSYYTTFNDRISALTNITADEKQSLDDQLKQTIEQRVLPAYQQLSDHLAALLPQAPANIGVGQFPGGQAYYDYTLRKFTTGTDSASQIHQQGIDELARIHQQMRTLFGQRGYPQGESISESYQRAINERTILGPDAVSFYEDLISETYAKLPEIFSTLPQQQVVVIGGTSGGFYISGSDDGTRPGAFYAQTNTTLSYATMPTLAYHEAVPGHHLQIALANELDLPQIRRKARFTAFIEGWALYAERLAADMGWYADDSLGDLGRLQFEAMRAARLVVDTGIHNLGWTYQQADNFHQENVGLPGAIARYSVWPGQATAYMTGMLKILQLRERAQSQLGELYDIRDFHDAVVGNGLMPLGVLEGVVDRYIADKLAQKR